MGPLRLEGKSWPEAETLITTGIHLISETTQESQSGRAADRSCDEI